MVTALATPTVTLSVATINAYLLDIVILILRMSANAMTYALNTTKLTPNAAMESVSLQAMTVTLQVHVMTFYAQEV